MKTDDYNEVNGGMCVCKEDNCNKESERELEEEAGKKSNYKYLTLELPGPYIY